MTEIQSERAEMGASRQATDDKKGVRRPVSITTEGVINSQLQSKEELERAVPFWNGQPIIIEHPPDGSVTVDDHEIVVGFTEGARGIMKNGIYSVVADAVIYDDAQYNGTHVNAMIDARGGKIDVSQGFLRDLVPNEGSVDGKRYSMERKNILPQHLAILVDSTPACAQPQCGVGVDADKRRKVFIDERGFNSNIGLTNGDAQMPNEPVPPIKQKAEPISVGDMGIDALAETNKCVKTAVDGLAEAKNAGADMKAEIAKMTAEKVEMQKGLDELKAIREAELDVLRKQVGAANDSEDKPIFDEKELAGMGKDELTRLVKVIGKPAVAEGAAADAGADKQTAQVRAPATKNAGTEKLSVGTPDRDGKWQPFK